MSVYFPEIMSFASKMAKELNYGCLGQWCAFGLAYYSIYRVCKIIMAVPKASYGNLYLQICLRACAWMCSSRAAACVSVDVVFLCLCMCGCVTESVCVAVLCG